MRRPRPPAAPGPRELRLRTAVCGYRATSGSSPIGLRGCIGGSHEGRRPRAGLRRNRHGCRPGVAWARGRRRRRRRGEGRRDRSRPEPGGRARDRRAGGRRRGVGQVARHHGHERRRGVRRCLAGLRRHPVGPPRGDRPLLHRSRPRRPPRGHVGGLAAVVGVPLRRDQEHRAPGHGRDGRGTRLRRLRAPARLVRGHGHVPGVPARGLWRRGLLRPSVRGGRDCARVHPTGHGRALRVPRPGDPRRRRRDRGGAQVRVQRLPRDEGVLRERDGPDLPLPRRRLPRRDAHLLRGPQAQRRAHLPSAGIRLRGVVPAEGPARPAAHGPDERCRCTPAGRDHADQRARGPRRRRADHRLEQQEGLPARAQLQDGHRRPAGEPQRRARRAPRGQGLRRPHLRPDHQPRPPRGGQPPARRGEAAAPEPAARLLPRGGVGRRGGRGRLVVRTRRTLRPGRCVAGPGPRPPRPSRRRRRAARRVRGARLVNTWRRRDPVSAAPRVLIIVQNLHVPFDRRVWLECQSLVGAGYDVTVICPRGKTSKKYEVIDRVAIHTYPPYAPGGSAVGFVVEYAWSFLTTARLALRARRRRGPFDVVQACNPPDIFWPLARWLRTRDGSRFVFDHHDLCPELYESRFPGGPRMLLRGLLFLERQTFRAADRVTSTNRSYADIAVARGGKAPAEVTVVRTGPDPDRLKRRAPSPELRRGRQHLVAYLGVMGPQDGVDIVIQAADIVVNSMGRRDITFCLMGSGDMRPQLLAERDRLGLGDYVEMPGRVSDEVMADVLSTADIGLCPDPLNPLNEVSTMNKTMEYMAFEVPVVAFDLRETKVSAGEAARYVTPNSVEDYARTIVELVDDAEARERMGRLGRQRVEDHLAWSHQQVAYRAVFDELVGLGGRHHAVTGAPAE